MIFDIFPFAYGPMAVTWFRKIEKNFKKRLIMGVTFRDSLIAYCCKNECHLPKNRQSMSVVVIHRHIICKVYNLFVSYL